jgi:hypothetical protein
MILPLFLLLLALLSIKGYRICACLFAALAVIVRLAWEVNAAGPTLQELWAGLLFLWA